MAFVDVLAGTLRSTGASDIQLLVGLVVSGLLAITTAAAYRLWFHPLAAFPGPRAAALSQHWHARASIGKYFEDHLDELHNKYGSVVRIAPNELHIRAPELYADIYSQNTTYYKPECFYQSLNIPHSLTTEEDPHIHRGMRRALNPYFSKRSVEQLSSIVLAKIEKLERKLRRLNKTFDAHDAARCLTVELISEYAFGLDVDMIEASADTFDAEFLDTFDIALLSQPVLQHYPTLSRLKFHLPWFILLRLDKKIGKLLQLDEWATGCLDQYKRKLKSEGTMDHPVLFNSLTELSDERKRSMSSELLVAGADTSALTITYALYHITSNPHINDRLTKELLEAMPSMNTTPILQKLEQLPFLTACVKESLRLACPVPGTLPRIVPKDKPLIIDGKQIAAGTIIGMSIYNLHFDKCIWGPDVHEFKPEKWLGGGEERLDRWLAPFSKGARACIGQNLALAEIRLTIATLFRRFEFSLPQGAKLNKRYHGFVSYLDRPGLPLQCKPKEE